MCTLESNVEDQIHNLGANFTFFYKYSNTHITAIWDQTIQKIAYKRNFTQTWYITSINGNYNIIN